MFLAGLEPATFRVLGGRDNHYTTETDTISVKFIYIFKDKYTDKLLNTFMKSFRPTCQTCTVIFSKPRFRLCP